MSQVPYCLKCHQEPTFLKLLLNCEGHFQLLVGGNVQIMTLGILVGLVKRSGQSPTTKQPITIAVCSCLLLLACKLQTSKGMAKQLGQTTGQFCHFPEASAGTCSALVFHYLQEPPGATKVVSHNIIKEEVDTEIRQVI